MAKQPMRLPPLKVLRVKQPNKKPENPCIAVMSSVLGYNTQGCAALENALRTCMDQPAAPPQASSSINYHLNRMQDRVIPRSKEKKPVKNSI